MIDTTALLLCDRSVALKRLVLETLIEEPDEDERVWAGAHAAADTIAEDLLSRQQPDGSWSQPETSWAMLRLAALGMADHPAAGSAAEHLYESQNIDGSWPIPSASLDDGSAGQRYDSIPLQTSLPLAGLAACGFATDPRSEKAYDWLLEQRLEDGSWPAGRVSGVFGYVAGYRRLPHSRWGCRSNTTGAALALSLHPDRLRGPEFRRAVDLLLARETRDRACLGFETARLLGFEPVRGFFTRFARHDPAFMLELAVAAGAGREDARVNDLANWIEAERTAAGIWHYHANPNASHWVTYRLLHTLRRLDTPGAERGSQEAWLSSEPRTPFIPYLRPRKRH